MSVTSDQIDLTVLRLAEVDYLDLWAIMRLLIAEFGKEIGHDPTAVAMASVGRLVASGSLEVGDLVPPGEFEPWASGADDSLAVIRRRLAELDRPLNVGDVGWFARVE